MKRIIKVIVAISILFSCNTKKVDNRKKLNPNDTNYVSLKDTLVIFTSACKGCEFSATYQFVDSLGIIKETNSKSIDNCPECDGGSYQLEIEFVPLKTGKTTLKMYQHEYTINSVDISDTLDYEQKPMIMDSTLIATFLIEIK